MSLHEKKGNNIMLIPRQEVIDNHPYIFVFSIKVPVRILKDFAILSSNCITSIHKHENSYTVTKNVGMGLSMTSCLGKALCYSPSFS